MNRLPQSLRELRSGVRGSIRWLAHTFEGRGSAEFSSEKAIAAKKRIARQLYNVVFAITAAYILCHPSPYMGLFKTFHTGDMAEADIVAPLSTDVEPKEAPRSTREEMAKKVAPIFDYDDSILEAWLRKWELAFRHIRNTYYNPKNQRPKAAPSLETVHSEVLKITGQEIPRRYLTYLTEQRFSVSTEQSFVKVAEYMMGRLIAPTDLFPAHYSTGIVVRQVNQDSAETLVLDVSRIWSIDQAREFLIHVPALLRAQKIQHDAKVVDVINQLIIPNLSYNAQLTQKRINAYIGQSRASVHAIKKGQILVKRGERVTEAQADLLEAVHGLVTGPAQLRRLALTTFVFFVFLSALFRLNITRSGIWYLSLKDALFFLFVTNVSLICIKYSIPYLRTFFAPLQLRYGAEYLLPISTGGIILHLMMGREVAYTYAVLLSVFIGFFLEQNYLFAMWAFTVMATAIHTIKACKQRTDLYKCGGWSGAAGGSVVLCLSLILSMGLYSNDWLGIGISVGLAFISGVLGAVLAGSVIPILEAVFGYTTSLKLLELSNFNHPLLHTLMMKAPGTYHHSVIVGSLAEIAADRIRANGILARVSAYYHDIGKMSKPLYFIENQSANANPHDHLAPSMSAKILFSHVKNGVRLAHEYNLGKKITDIIEQHHGTTTIQYFLNKAKTREKPELDPVNDSDFRYPGPRPQSREAAIVMIADACEAATRSIAEPTPAKIQTMVHSIINKRISEQQFSECELTFSDLQVIEESFTRTLVSLYHHRIEYPGQKKNLPKSSQPQIPVRKVHG